MLSLGIVVVIGNKQGNSAQFMVIETAYKTLREFMDYISSNDFVIVNEKYRKKGEDRFSRVRECVLNTNLIGRVSEYETDEY